MSPASVGLFKSVYLLVGVSLDAVGLKRGFLCGLAGTPSADLRAHDLAYPDDPLAIWCPWRPSAALPSAGNRWNWGTMLWTSAFL